MLYATSVAVSEAPLWKVCPDATLSVHLEPSSVDHSLTTLGLTSKLLSHLNYVLIDKAADELVIRIRRGERIHAVALIAVECENIVCRSGLAKLLACAFDP